MADPPDTQLWLYTYTVYTRINPFLFLNLSCWKRNPTTDCHWKTFLSILGLWRMQKPLKELHLLVTLMLVRVHQL